MTPLLLTVTLPPTVRVPVPPLAPPPASEATVWSKLAKSSTAPAVLASVTALPAGRAPATPARRVPALIVVAPAYVFRPPSTQVPAPLFVRLVVPPPRTGV